MIRRNRRRDVDVDPRGGMPRWSRDDCLPWSIEAAAREALDPWDDPEPGDGGEEEAA